MPHINWKPGELSINEAGRRLGINYRTVWHLIEDGVLKGGTIQRPRHKKRRYRYADEADVMRRARSREQQPT